MKRLKDPIYGYIDIDDDIIDYIIDTATFQRLRTIIQTSYAPLFASAVHNRFVHSLGVYHLGKIVAHSFETSAKETEIISSDLIDNKIKIFEYACLLHDVGHAPFSHTGEEFYLGPDSSRAELHKTIAELTGDTQLENEIKLKNYAAAPHELMSIIVALKSFPELFKNDEDKSFFARCISGYLYVNDLNEQKSFFNCMIEMLNSSVIDVDKLDYLIRDAYITGFDTVSIDYTRLLRSVKIICVDGKYKLVFTKAAISVIENVVFAHDAERKWIQNHPVVLYDAYLLRHALEKLNSQYNVFSFDALTLKGTKLSNEFYVSLLSDGDITFLMKNISGDSFVDEYFSRKDRRHPLWKSEAEYKAIFGLGFSDAIFQRVENELDSLAKYVSFANKSPEMNANALKAIEEDIKSTNEMIKPEFADAEHFRNQLHIKQRHLKWLKCLQDFAIEQNIDFDFLVIKANPFNSGFGKLAFENIEIVFPGLTSLCNFKKVTNALSAQKSEREKFSYIFYRRKDRTCQVDAKRLASKLGALAIEEAFS